MWVRVTVVATLLWLISAVTWAEPITVNISATVLTSGDTTKPPDGCTVSDRVVYC